MDSVAMDTCKVLVAGDVNVRVDNESNNDTRRFLDLLNAGYLTQNLEGRTRDVENPVDLLTTRSSDAFRNNIGIDIPHMSDHSAIQRTLRLANPPKVQVTTKSRSYKLISTSAICEDIRSLLLSNHLPGDTNYTLCILKPWERLVTNMHR